MDEYGNVEGEMKGYMQEEGGWFPVYTTPLNPMDSIKSSKTLDAQPQQERKCDNCGEFGSCCQQPQREWVGLTDEEMHACWDSPLTPLGMKHVRMIEAKLKQKNGYAVDKNT